MWGLVVLQKAGSAAGAHAGQLQKGHVPLELGLPLSPLGPTAGDWSMNISIPFHKGAQEAHWQIGQGRLAGGFSLNKTHQQHLSQEIFPRTKHLVKAQWPSFWHPWSKGSAGISRETAYSIILIRLPGLLPSLFKRKVLVTSERL